MDAGFWRRRWETNDIAFHQSNTNPLLVKYLGELSLAKGRRIFVPLCGKTLDIHWLLSSGYQVTGVELSKAAVEQLFAELQLTPSISRRGEVEQYSASNIEIFAGSIFDVSGETLGAVDAIYDRAALVALPESMRDRYTAHLIEITDAAPQLLICYEYDQRSMDGPPFSVSNAEVRRHYADSYDLTFAASVDVAGGLKGRCPAKENVWLLKAD